MSTSTKCQEVALLVAPPLEFTAFASRAPVSDWLAKYHRPEASHEERHSHLRHVWQNEYEPLIAKPLAHLVAAARERDVTVACEATLSSLADATARHQVVIVIAHWKGPEVTNDDLRSSDVRKYVERARRSESAVGRWLFNHLSEIGSVSESKGLIQWFRLGLLQGSRASSRTLRETLEEALTADLPNAPLTDEGIDCQLKHPAIQAAERRDEIDQMFFDVMTPGNRLELADGLHSKEAVETAVAADFCGTLDLTTCTSSVLATHLSRRRRQRLRTVQFPEEQDFMWCALCIGTTLDVYANSANSYLEARALSTILTTIAVARQCEVRQ